MIDTGKNTGKAAFAAALAAVVIGAGVLAGWLFELEFLKRIAPGLVAMNPATAAAFILAGASLALFLLSPRGKDQKPRALILTARLCALVVALIGLAKLAGILCGWDFGVDQWLFASQLTDSVRFPNRMAPNTAFNFLLLGGALLFVDVKNRSARFWSEFSVVLVGLGSLLAVLAYVYDIQSFYGLSAFIPMALHTAITFLVLVVAFLLSHTDSGLLAVFVGDSAGGTMARRLLPAAVLVPAVFGWLTLQGEKAGIYHGQFSDAVFAVGNILVFAFLVCWSAKELFSADLGRKKAEEALHDSQALYRSLVDQMPAGIFRKDAEGRYVFVNSLFCQVMEMSVDQILGKTSSELVACMSATQATRRPVSDKLGTQGMSHHESVMRTGRPIVVADEYQGSDGKRSYYHTVKSPVFGPDGKIVGTQGMLFDITDRKQAEAELSYERDLLRALLDNLPDQIYFKDAQSHFLKASKTQAENFGLKSADELVGKTDFDFFTEEHARPAFEDEQEIIRTGRPLIGKVEKEVLKGGRESWALTSKMPLRNKDGQIIGTFGISKNITAIKEADEARRQSEQLLQAMFDNSPDRIYFKDTQSRFLKLSHVLAKRLGLENPDLAIGKTDFDFQPPDRAREFFEDEQHIFQTGEPLINKTEKQILPNGEIGWTSTTKAPLRDQEGKIFGLVGINRDITQEKQVEEMLRQQNVYLTALQETTLDVISQLDLDRLLENMVKRAGQLMGTSTGFLDLLEPGEDHLTPKIAFGALAEESLKFPVKLGEGLGGKVWQTGQPMLIEDYDAWPGRIKSHQGNLIQSIIEVPLLSKSGFVGVLGLAHEKGTNRTFGPEAVERLSQFARFATIAIENARLYSTIQWELTERKRTEAKLEQVHKQLLETSRRAGMAEVATNVLHNVGNVLNSVNVSASVVTDSVKKSKVASLANVVALLREHEHDLGTFITSDTKGKQLPGYLSQLSDHLLADQKTTVKELESLRGNVEHIKEIVAMQQSYAKVSGVKEIVNLCDLVEDSLRMNVGSFNRHGVEVIREFEDVPLMNIEKHKILQILINLIRNAKHACQDSDRADKQLTVRVANGAGRVKVSVIDNGIGISPENLTRIFSHGFTTRKDGHGFGLHSGALAAQEMGGSLTVHSEGLGRGATFTLELPCTTNEDSNE
jgi:PAS domain S-box-containing protein